MRQWYSKIRKFAIYSFLVLIGLLLITGVGFYWFMTSDSGKAWLTHKANTTVASALQTKVNIDSVRYQFPAKVRLYQTTIYDHRDQIMFKLPKTEVGFFKYSVLLNSLIFRDIEFEEPEIYARKYPGDTAFNHAYVFSNVGNDNEDEGFYRLLFKNIVLSDGSIKRKVLDEAPEEGMMDFSHMDLSNVDLHVDFLQVIDENISAKIDTLRFKDESGFQVDRLATVLEYTPTKFSFSELLIKTPYSRITNHYAMRYDNPKAFQDFLHEVDLNVRFKNSHLSFKDLSYFAAGIQRNDKRVQFAGNIKGSIDGFKSKDFYLAFGDSSYFKGALNFNGLPNIQETFMDIAFKEAEFNKEDVSYLAPQAEIPQILGKLGQVKLNGKFTGFISDFVSYGHFRTALGHIQTDINLENSFSDKNASYSGALKLDDFNIGRLMEEDLLGQVSMNASINGDGLGLEHLDANLDGNIQKLDLNNYEYNNIEVEGNIAKKLFKGDLKIKDEAIGLDFEGTVDLNQTKPEFDFVADVKGADFYTLNLVQDTLILDSELKMNFQANNMDDIEGNVAINNTHLELSDQSHDFDSLSLTSSIENKNKQLELTSDIANVSLKGQYNISELPELITYTGTRYFSDSLIAQDSIDAATKRQKITFKADIKNASFLMDLVHPDFFMDDNSSISGTINGKTGNLKINGNFPGIYYKDYYAKAIRINGSGTRQSLSLQTQAAKIFQSDSLITRDNRVEFITMEDSIQVNLHTAQASRKNYIDLNAMVKYNGNNTSMRFCDSKISLNDTFWTVRSDNITIHNDLLIEVPLLALTHQDEKISVTGNVTKSSDQPLRVLMDNVKLNNFGNLGIDALANYNGKLNGQVMAYDLLGDPYFNSGLFVSPLSFKEDTLGHLSFHSNYHAKNHNIDLNASLRDQNQKEVMELFGYINFKARENLHLDVNIQESQFAMIEGFVNDYISDLDGTFSSDVAIRGTFDKPDISGSLSFNEAYFTLNLLNTRYHFTDQIDFNEREININNLVLYDKRAKSTVASGVITHKFFNDFQFDINMKANNFTVLNTSKTTGETFYGDAYASGPISIDGPANNLTLSMQLKTEPNTKVYLPIGDDSDYSGYDFIRFVDKAQYFERDYNVDLKGVNLNLDFEVTPDAEVQILFDPSIGDRLKSSGTGNIRMELDASGDFSMFGTYTIEKGDYYFTAFDIIKKHFKLQEGGYIKWNGSPTEAQVNIDAGYKVYTSPEPLISQNELTESVPQQIPVEAQLAMSGSLFSPEIDLDFEILDGSGVNNEYTSRLQSRVRAIKSDEQELNKQVTSLLVMSQFFPSSQQKFSASKATGSAINSGVSDLISSQLTYWLSEMSEDVKYLENIELGVDYQMEGSSDGQGRNYNSEELEVALSTTLFDDRVNVSTSYGNRSVTPNVEVSYKLTQEGKVRVKVFNRSNTNPLINEQIQTQGAGLIWKKEFDSWDDFFSRDESDKEQPQDGQQEQEGNLRKENEDQESEQEQKSDGVP